VQLDRAKTVHWSLASEMNTVRFFAATVRSIHPGHRPAGRCGEFMPRSCRIVALSQGALLS
jgi:hypothetical protein